MRTKKSVFNLVTAVVGQVISLFLSLIARMVFTRYMAQEYLGLSGLFTNILSVLSFVELGIGPAITFSLYKPLAENNIEQVKSLMHLFKRAYQIIGTFILVVGVFFTPLYPFFIKDISGVTNLDLIYLLYVANTGISYFFSYKITLIIADQNQYIRNFVHYGVLFITNIAQIVILIFTQNYILFLICQVVFTFSENLLLAYVADRKYPYLKEQNINKLSRDELQPIVRNIKAMVFHKVGSVVVSSTDNLLISKFLGLAISGLYANYALILSAINTILAKVFDAVVASVGNLNALEDVKGLQMVYNRLYFLSFWLYGFCSVCLFCLIQPFIELAFGKHYLLDFLTVIALVVSFYTVGMRHAPNVARSAAGLYYRDWPKPIFELLVNFVASIVFLKIWGVSGVFWGTVASTVLVCAWVEAYVVYHHALHLPFGSFFRDYIKYVMSTLLAGAITWAICQMLSIKGLIGLIAKILVCVTLPNIVFLLLYWNDANLKFFLQLLYRGIGLVYKPTRSYREE